LRYTGFIIRRTSAIKQSAFADKTRKLSPKLSVKNLIFNHNLQNNRCVVLPKPTFGVVELKFKRFI